MSDKLFEAAEKHGAAFAIGDRVFTDPREFAEASGVEYSEHDLASGRRFGTLSYGEAESASGSWIERWNENVADRIAE